MTKNNVAKKLKSSLILVITIIGLVCISLFGLISCSDNNNKTSDIKDPSNFSAETSADSLFTNSDFSDKANNQNFSKDPIILTTSGWTRAEDNAGGRNSKVNSGVIDVSSNGWDSLLSYLYDDTEFNAYMKKKFDIPSTLTEKDDVLAKYKEVFANPSKPADAKDDNIYMLNNYLELSNYGLGTAQKLTSSSVTLDADSYYQITFWVKTANLSSMNAEENIGANVRLSSTIGGKPQQDVKITNIVANDWKKFDFYIKSDAKYSCTVAMNFCLGMGEGDYNLAKNFTEGTLFIDGVTCKKLDSAPTNYNEVVDFSYASKDEISYNNKTNSSSSFYYDMKVTAPTNYFTNIETSSIAGKKTSNDAQSFENFTESKTSEEYKATLTNTSATLSINNSNFVVNSKEYVYVKFDLKATFSDFGNSNITVDVFDTLGSITKKRAAVATLASSGEYYTFGFIIKNNFEEVDSRKFSIDIVVGPTAISDVSSKFDYATGTVSIKNLKFAKGEFNEEAENYDFYSLYAANAIGTVALYAGSSQDYSEQNSNVVSYDLSTKPGNIGDIVSFPTDVNGLDGVVANHKFINHESSNTIINDRSGEFGDGKGNYAGLINSNYIDAYASKISALSSLRTNLNYTGDQSIQPLMIYNGTKNHYGYITTGTKTISSNSYAKISVDVRVTDSAEAYIYLVNNGKEDKNVLTFNKFTSNDTVVNEREMFFKVNKSVMDAKAVDGWVTVTFYIATGANKFDFRIELWNGARDGKDETASKGYVFFNNIKSQLTNAFTEATEIDDTFTVSGNPLYDLTRQNINTIYTHQRELTDVEKKYNKENSSTPVEYKTKYIWAENENTIYAIYNTLDVTAKDPYANQDTTEETPAGSNCAASTDPATFWLSFSSIVLAGILLIAIIALIAKRVIAKKKANASDAKSHYTVKSRINTHKENVKKSANTKEVEEATEEVVEDEIVEEVVEEQTEETSDVPAEETLDDYVYGDVQEFDDNAETNNEEVEENTSDENN